MRGLLVVALLLAAASGTAAQADPTGAGVTIVVVDTGIDGDHPEFAGRVSRQSFVEAGGIDFPGGFGTVLGDDPDGQGTQVASVAAGSSLGMAPTAELVDLQVSLGGPLREQLDGDDERAAIAALDWLLRNAAGPTVVVVSVAARSLSEAGAATLAEQARGLYDLGVAVVVPVAPQWSELHSSGYVLTVGGVVDGQPQGPAAPSGISKPDMVAVSNDLEVAVAGGAGGAGRGLGAATGNHLAAGIVAGALATLWDLRPDLPLEAALAILRDTAVDIGEPGFDPLAGFGELNLPLAQERADAWKDPLGPGRDGRDTPGVGVVALLALIGCLAAARRRS